MKRFWCLTSVVIALALLGASAANAATFSSTATVSRDFVGEQCGSGAFAALTLPRGALRPRFVAPAVGETLVSSEDDVTPVATLTSRALRRLDSRWVAFFLATGSDDVCDQPANYPDGWTTVDVDLSVRYDHRERIYVRGRPGTAARRRPRRIRYGAGSLLTGLRWNSWDGRVVRGRGRARADSGRGRAFYPVAVRLSRPTKCGSRYLYLSLRYRFTGRVPPGLGRTQRVRFDFLCSS